MSDDRATPKVTGLRDRFGALLFAVVALVAALVGCADEAPPEDERPDPDGQVDLGSPPDPETVLDEDRGAPSTELRAEDLAVGEGDVAREGAELAMQYLGVRWSDGGPFDSSWESGQPFRFELGAGQVIEGWDRGIAGDGVDVGPMRVGGRRVLVIPPDLAYGDRGAGEAIGPGETLVFVIDLVEVGSSS